MKGAGFLLDVSKHDEEGSDRAIRQGVLHGQQTIAFGGPYCDCGYKKRTRYETDRHFCILLSLLVYLLPLHRYGQKEPYRTSFLSRCRPEGGTRTSGAGESCTAGEIHHSYPAWQFASFYSRVFCFRVGIEKYPRLELLWNSLLFFLTLGEGLGGFDLVIIDLLWWRNTKRIRFSFLPEQSHYQDPTKHVSSFLRGIPLFAAVAVLSALIVQGVYL